MQNGFYSNGMDLPTAALVSLKHWWYGEEVGSAYSFRTRPIGSLSYLVGARGPTEDFVAELKKDPIADEIEAERKRYYERAEREIESLSLNELYSVHNSYVLNIFRQRYIFSESYIEELCANFKDLFHEPAEVREMLYMKHIEPESIGSDPLDKLCRDIDREVDWLERMGTR